MTVSVGEKQVTSLRLRLLGRAAHASVPAGAENPLRHAATAVERLLAPRAGADWCRGGAGARGARRTGRPDPERAVEWAAASTRSSRLCCRRWSG